MDRMLFLEDMVCWLKISVKYGLLSYNLWFKDVLEFINIIGIISVIFSYIW